MKRDCFGVPSVRSLVADRLAVPDKLSLELMPTLLRLGTAPAMAISKVTSQARALKKICCGGRQKIQPIVFCSAFDLRKKYMQHAARACAIAIALAIGTPAIALSNESE